MAYLDEAIGQAYDADEARPRSQQRQVGWSDISSCRAQLGYEIAGQWASDYEDRWRAIAGTALHEWLTGVRQEAVSAAGQVATFGQLVTYRGIPGHADEINYTLGEITDWKFPTLAFSRIWDDPDALETRFIQPQGYAAAVMSTPAWRELAPDPDNAVVRVLVAPVDGKFADWRVYERLFEREVADAAVDRYLDVVDAVAEGSQLPRDKEYFWCERYCRFFTRCRGGSKPAEPEEIHDPETAAAIERYGLASMQISQAETVRKELAPLLRDVSGYARGFKVSWSRQGQDKKVDDEDEIARFFGMHGETVPQVVKPGKAPYLIINPVKR